MKNFLLAALALLLSVAQLFAARQTPTTGRIIDDSGKGVDFATVILLAAAGAVLAAAVAVVVILLVKRAKRKKTAADQ